jgi:hypothetical protein
MDTTTVEVVLVALGLALDFLLRRELPTQLQ